MKKTTTVINVKKEECDFYIGRKVTSARRETSFLANPFKVDKHMSRGRAIEEYAEWFYEQIKEDPDFEHRVNKLKGKVLGCWCKPKPCHGDIIVAYLEEQPIIKQTKLF